MKKDFAVEERFGEVITGENWGIVPFAFYKYQKQLELKIAEVWFLSWLVMHKWGFDDPYPSLSALERYTGKSRSYIQRITRGLSEKGLIEIKERHLDNGARASNFYDILELLKRLEDEIKNDPRSDYSKENTIEKERNGPFEVEGEHSLESKCQPA